ncbi:hypothetical protein BV898_01575 [Hypsibius exemplaris]|uniref:Uncharacterized protein n=1 Tax=Hypsibius exemplaris TaxID=2072580 RepID=A0A1W0XAJ4_HYPEX|nr:hypothetical protein BV898_01575 [Hypsibius exemplaris]
MLLYNGPLTIFKIVLVSLSLFCNVVCFRCHPCNCGRRRCRILPLFLAGNILTLVLQIPDILAGFRIYFPLERGNCSFNFVASYLLCTYFVALGVLRKVLSSAALQTYRVFFYGCLACAPLLSVGIQAVYANSAVDEPLMLHLAVPVTSGPEKEILIPLASCAKNICSSGDVVLTVLSSLVPALVPIVSLAVCILVSYSAKKRMREKTGTKENTAFHPLIPEYCDREQNCWPILKFVLLLFLAWTVLAKPMTILLTHLTRLYADGNFGVKETSVYVCSSFWDMGNHVILFTSATLTPLVFVCTYRPWCQRSHDFSPDLKGCNGVDRPVTVMGSISDMDIGTFTWDTFTFVPPYEKQIALRGLEGIKRSSA